MRGLGKYLNWVKLWWEYQAQRIKQILLQTMDKK